jgi:hypothetical protein
MLFAFWAVERRSCGNVCQGVLNPRLFYEQWHSESTIDDRGAFGDDKPESILHRNHLL